MSETVSFEAERPVGNIILGPRFGYSLGPVVPALLFLAVYATFAWGIGNCGLPQLLGAFALTAGLSQGFLLTHGLWYAPVVLLAIIGNTFWINPLPFPMPVALVYCAIVSLIHVATVSLLKRFSSGSGVSLKKASDVAAFILVGSLASVTLAIASTTPLLLSNPIHWNLLVSELRLHLVGFAAGIFFIVPLLVIHVGPWLETALFGIKAERQTLSKGLPALRIKKQDAIFALSFIALAAAALWLLFNAGVPERLYVFIVLSAPLIWVAARRGLEGLSIAVPLLASACLAALMYFQKSPANANELLTILLFAALNAYLIGAGITQTRMTIRHMERRDAILEAVSFAAQQFLGETGWETGVRQVLKSLGEATSVSRVYLIDNRTPSLGGQVGDTCQYEWLNPSLEAENADERVLNLLRRQMIEELSTKFSAGQPCLFRTKNFDRKKREMLETLGIRSGAIIPMFVDRQWWGCLGLEQCYVDRGWPDSEVDGLRMAGQILGMLIASVRVEHQFRQLTGNIQAVFWISSPDGRSKQYVSPGYEEVWGRTCASLQRNPGSWIEAIHAEDRNRVSAALMKQVRGEYNEEYRVERPDGSMRWVHDRAFPVRDQLGRVDRIVGIAEDITKQKEAEEQLRAATVMLSTLINHLHSGVMVEDESRRITHVNLAFNNIFGVPVSPESLFGVDSRLLFIQTAEFSQRIEHVIRDKTPILGEELEWQGRIFLRNYVPLLINDNNYYHLWQYQDVTNSRRAEEQIKTSLKEKEVLLKEIHHRVKNNLQIISSLLNLQSAEIQDRTASQKFRESQDRVKAMALIHERLYQSSDLAKIDFAGYVRSLTGHLQRSYRINANTTRLNLDVQSVPMNLDLAIPCGLIINELVSNAFKYAFPKSEEGDISVRFGQKDHRTLSLSVRDSGVGFPEDKNPEDCDSLGLKLVRSLSEQIGGTIKYRNEDGFVCDIHIPNSKA